MKLQFHHALGALALFCIAYIAMDTLRQAPPAAKNALNTRTPDGELQTSYSSEQFPARSSSQQQATDDASLRVQTKDKSWTECFSSSNANLTEAELMHCVSQKLLTGQATPTAEELGEWLCGSTLTKSTIKKLCIEVLSTVPPNEVLTYIDAAQVICGRYESTEFFKTCFSYMRHSHAEWLESVGRTLTPDVLFDENRGIAIIQVAHTLSRIPGGDWAEYLLAEGGLGNFGGTPMQVERAIAQTFTLKKTPGERLRYVSDVIGSPNSPSGSKIGSTLMCFLFAKTGECWPNGDSRDAIAYANKVLDDDRFAKEAAGQLLYDFSLQKPPKVKGLDVNAWKLLVLKAKEIKGRK